MKPRKSKVGALDLQEVDDVYSREAFNYNRKHHLTTRGMDLVWRRNIGWNIAINSISKDKPITVLDLCTGTGLTVQEICKVLEKWNIDANIVGLDFNSEMLAIAKSDSLRNGNYNINFVRGDAMNLIKGRNNSNIGLVRFEVNTFDFITQMFGIGGIIDPVKVFKNVIEILKPKGQFFLIDMHRPIPQLSGEWPLFLNWLKFPSFETYIYERSTIPLVLNKLWGWRDTTLCFYLLPLITYKDNSNNFWGFETVYFEYEPQRWWFALPFMPIAKIIVRKVEINEEEANKRGIILKSCNFHF